MSICRTTIMETHTKEDLDLMLADYIENFDSMFPEAELALSVRISPTTNDLDKQFSLCRPGYS